MNVRIGLLVDSPFVPGWAARLVEQLQTLNGAEIVALIDTGNPPAVSSLLDSYFKLERRFLHNIPEPAPMQDVRNMLSNAAIISVADVPSIQSQNLDFIISFQADLQFRALSARWGVWTWSDISPDAGFREVFTRAPLTFCVLSANLPSGQRKILRRAVFSTDPLSAARNRNRVYMKAASALLWALKKMTIQGEREFFSRLENEAQLDLPRKANFFEIIALIFKQMARALEKKFRPLEMWLVFAEKSASDSLAANPSARASLIAPPGMYWADPIAIERDGRVYLFVEEYIRAERKGRIVCLTLDSNARVESSAVALERPYHLSYPFIFEYNGETYMIPETASRRAIELYRCVEFPQRWEFAGELMKDIYAVDTTLLNHAGKWWLFANVMTEPGASSWDELHIFFADSPFSSSWTPHSLNPLISDARTARPAGLFFTLDGVLYRPSQDSSLRYGYAINLNRVDVLNEREYSETRIQKILPQRGFLAAHTYSRAGGWIFTDGVTRNIKRAL